MQSSRSALHTLHALSRTLPSVPSTSQAALSRPAFEQQKRHASFSLSSLRNLLPSRKKDQTPAGTDAAAAAAQAEQPVGLFDAAVEDEEVVVERQRSGYAPGAPKPATFHKSSTANFKTSRRKLNDLARLVAGRTADEALLQLQASQKKQAPRLLSMIALARDHAIAKGLSRDKLVIAQSWTTQGPSLARLDIKGRGRHGIKHHPSSKLHVLLAEGVTEEQRRRARRQDQWRASLRGLTEGDGVGVVPEGRRSRPVINAPIGQWRW
ncbi:hypothetical protein JCM1841_003623 [Sporobolomyces salmonicolor]